MISVQEAIQQIQQQTIQLPIIEVDLEDAIGYILQEEIRADRDFPPFNRVTMDGIAIKFSDFEKGVRTFAIQGIQLAGEPQKSLEGQQTCLEIMTGAVLSEGADTVIRYEDVTISEKEGQRFASISSENYSRGQNIHKRATDRKSEDLLVSPGIRISPAEVAVAASVGKKRLQVNALPKIAIISTGDELVEVDQIPLPHQIRKSNVYAVQAGLKEQFGIQARLYHLNDDKEVLHSRLQEILSAFDVLILSGGVSKGKADYVPEILDRLGVKKAFHRVKQRPGKPFWFGATPDQKVVFALPGNPVSTFLNAYKYVFPWISTALGQQASPQIFAQLAAEFTFKPSMTYFLQVQLKYNPQGILQAHPIEGKGSGDFANLLDCDAFVELPENQEHFRKGEVFSVIPYRFGFSSMR
ncbi:molybdopterin molybdotransferase MoeA [Rapidithrix thailandica]|uniref:Molybdopterin molybdenumtransferase n=1 Tax=Rapidithrix thailandica TaxID=413964 RepID=A0AAW9RVG1_9BACT